MSRRATLVVLAFGLAAPAPAAEPASVAVSDEVRLADAARGKELPVLAVFPEQGGPFPVLVFSHGAGGSGRSVLPLPKFWASHGYVVLVPTHADSLSLRRGDDGPKEGAARGRLRDLLGDALRDPAAWQDRPKDVSFPLDSLDELEKKVPALVGKTDRERIGVGGHSYGAYTAQVVGGATLALPGRAEPVSVADARVDAVVLLSAQGPGQQGLTGDSWRAFRTPMLNVTGDRDRGAQGQGPDWKRKPFDLAPAGDKYHLDLVGAHHGSFTGRFADPNLGRRLRSDQAAIFERVKAVTLDFWDAVLKDDAAAKRSLAEKRVERESEGRATLLAK